jgi:DNA-binding MarR family transcriptional regulator
MAGATERNHQTDEIAGALRRSVTLLMRRLRLNRTEELLSPSKLIVLGSLYRGGPITATDLAARERIRPQSLTRLLASLEKRGFVSRQPDGTDRRCLLISLTEDGKKALEMDFRRREAWLSAAMTRYLSAVEREALFHASRLLDRLTEEESTPRDAHAERGGRAVRGKVAKVDPKMV